MKTEYQGIIFTKHALQRLKKRKITQDVVAKTLKAPEDKEKEDNGNTRFTKMVNQRKIQVIANYQSDERKWVVVSAWVRGEEDPQPLWKRFLLLPFRLFKRK